MPNQSPGFREDPHAPKDRDAVSLEVRRLLANSAIELSTNGESTIRRAAQSLALGTTVFVPKMPTQSLEAKLEQIRILNDVGLNPVPHIVARQLSSEKVLVDFLEQAVDVGGVRQVLVVGGDGFDPAGPFEDAASRHCKRDSHERRGLPRWAWWLSRWPPRDRSRASALRFGETKRCWHGSKTWR